MNNPKVDYYFLDNNNIIHKDGLIINLNTLKLTYNNNHNNYVCFNKIKTFFPGLMLKYFRGIQKVTRREVTHIDNNIYNNQITNIIYKPHKEKNYNRNLMNCIKKKQIVNNTYVNKYHYLLIFNKYDIEYKLLKSYNQISHLYIPNIREFILRLLNNEYIYHNEHFWNLEIKKIYLPNLDNYIKLLDNIYYIHKDLSHVINISNNTLLKIYLDIKGKHYVNLYKQKNNIIKLHLDYYENPSLYKINIDQILKNNISNLIQPNINNSLEIDELFDEFENYYTNKLDDFYTNKLDDSYNIEIKNYYNNKLDYSYTNEFENYYNTNDLDIEFDYLDNLQNYLTLL